MNRFYNDTKAQGLSVSKDTLYEYFSYLEDAFLVRAVSVFSKSERRRMVNPRKVYPVDPGLIPIFDRTGKADSGHALEICVMLELERRGSEISYVRTSSGFEVDFLALFPDGREQLIQVCDDLDDTAMREREIRALVEAAREHPRAGLNIVTLHPESVRNLPENLALHSAAPWLLS